MNSAIGAGRIIGQLSFDIDQLSIGDAVVVVIITDRVLKPFPK
jgi:hypothetical protein